MGRRRDIELIEKNIRHVRIEVLTGMDYHLFEAVGFANCATDGSRLDELRPGTDHGEYFEGHRPYALTCGT
jgi:hypothetical protein